MQFSVCLTHQDSSDPDCHHCSRGWAERAISADLAVKIGQNSIRLTVSGMKWPEAKHLMRGYVGTLNPEGYHVLPYTYPLPFDLLKHYQSGKHS